MQSPDRTAYQPEEFRGILPEVDAAPLFLARDATDRSRSRLSDGAELGKHATRRRDPAPKTLHNFTRRRNGLNAAYRSLLRQEICFGRPSRRARQLRPWWRRVA